MTHSADYAHPTTTEGVSVMEHTQYEQRVAVEVRDHAASLMERWVEDGRDDAEIDNIVKAVALNAYVSGRRQGRDEYATRPPRVRRSFEDNVSKHADECDSHFCPCYQEGREVLAASHWEMLVWIAERRPELLREALSHSDGKGAEGG